MKMASKSMVSRIKVKQKGHICQYPESRAICRYLEEKYKSKGAHLIPDGDIKSRFLFEQAVNIEAFNFEPAAIGLVREKFVKK